MNEMLYNHNIMIKEYLHFIKHHHPTIAKFFLHFMQFCNHNSGFISVILFTFTFSLGLFSALSRNPSKNPKFSLKIDGFPSFCSIFTKQSDDMGENIYCTAIILYLKVTNLGNAPASINSISIGANNNFFMQFFKKYQIKQNHFYSDFVVNIGENTKIYPFLTIKNSPTDNDNKTYLRPGETTEGLVYFETESHTNHFQALEDETINILITVKDAFKNNYKKKVKIPVIDINQARKYSQDFGKSIENQKKFHESSN